MNAHLQKGGKFKYSHLGSHDSPDSLHLQLELQTSQRGKEVSAATYFLQHVFHSQAPSAEQGS